MSAPVTGASRLRLADDARVAALVGFTLAAIGVVLDNTNMAPGENGGAGPMVFGVVLSGVVALGVGVLVFSRVRRHERAALILAVLALLTVVAFWSGLPFVLGTHAVALGRRSTGRLSVSAQVLGVLAIVAAAFVTAADRLS